MKSSTLIGGTVAVTAIGVVLAVVIKGSEVLGVSGLPRDPEVRARIMPRGWLPDADSRPFEAPICVSVKNTGGAPIKKGTISLGVFAEGDSTNLVREETVDWTKVVRENETVTQCLGVYLKEKILVHDAKVSVSMFAVERYRNGEMVP